MKIISTDKTLKRLEQLHDVCELCGATYDGDVIITSKYRETIGLILCDRCTDKVLSLLNNRNPDEYWKEEDATRNGFPLFDYSKARMIVKTRRYEIEQMAEAWIRK